MDRFTSYPYSSGIGWQSSCCFSDIMSVAPLFLLPSLWASPVASRLRRWLARCRDLRSRSTIGCSHLFALHLGALDVPVVGSTHGGRTVKQPPCMFRLALRIVEAQGAPSVSGWGSVLSEMSAGKSSKSSSEASDML